jgi:TolA-binding protein
MQSSPLIAGSLLALSATGCFATKGDIRLLQEEIRATRASAAQADSARRRTSDSLATALANLATVQANNARDAHAAQQKTADELKALASKTNNNDIAIREQLKAIGVDIDQLREITRQNARSSALARAQMEQANAAANNPPPTTPDSTSVAAPVSPTSAPPGPATLLIQGKGLVIQSSCATARRTFQDILTNFPNSPETPEAQYMIAESYVACGADGNPAKADSVYKLVIEKYPTSDWAATALYKRAEALRTANKMAEARPLYEKIVCDHPKSVVNNLALNRLGGTRPATCR